MSTVAVSTIVFLISYTTTTKSQPSLNCFRDRIDRCGPCTGTANPQCSLTCATWEDACAEIPITCQSGVPCNVNCQSRYSCMGSSDGPDILDATHSTRLTMNCAGISSCDGRRIQAGNNQDIQINCSGQENACKDLKLYAQTARNIDVNCNGASFACEGLLLVCGTGDCSISCQGGWGDCNRIQVVTQAARSFRCIGDCRSAPADFGNPGQVPSPPVVINPLPLPVPIPPPAINPRPVPVPPVVVPAPPAPPANPSPPAGSTGGGSPGVVFRPASCIRAICGPQGYDPQCCMPGGWDFICDFAANNWYVAECPPGIITPGTGI